MGRHLSPRYGQVILVSGYPVLTAVNWSQHWCAICVQYQSSCAPKLARKCEIEHWLPCGADGRADGRCTVTWLPNFLGWVDFLSYGAPPSRSAARGAPLLSSGGDVGRLAFIGVVTRSVNFIIWYGCRCWIKQVWDRHAWILAKFLFWVLWDEVEVSKNEKKNEVNIQPQLPNNPRQ